MNPDPRIGGRVASSSGLRRVARDSTIRQRFCAGSRRRKSECPEAAIAAAETQSNFARMKLSLNSASDIGTMPG